MVSFAGSLQLSLLAGDELAKAVVESPVERERARRSPTHLVSPPVDFQKVGTLSD